MRESKNLFKKFLPLLVLPGTLLVSLLVYKIAARPQVFLNTSSPRGTYTVQLAGPSGGARIPAIYHEVQFSVRKQERAFLSNEHLHSGDLLDPSFDLLYPQRTWINDGVLFFYREEFFSKGTPDTLTIRNNTDREINYLRVRADCMFLLFDVRPMSTIELSVPPPRGNLRWVGVEGQYSDGQRIQEHGADFIIRNLSGGPFIYHILITKDGSKIESPQLEKYTGNE